MLSGRRPACSGLAALLLFVTADDDIVLGLDLDDPAVGIDVVDGSYRRLLGGGRFKAARDLGASRLQAIRLALLPILVPAIVASAIIVFAISMDDFVISQFLSSGTNTDTVPVRIYSTGRTAPTPALNALATLTLAVTIVIASLGFLLWKLVRNVRGQTGSTVGEFAALEADPTR